jgi:hypothetical protein
MPWELQAYSDIYAEAMLKETGPKGDGVYTAKSHIYEAVNAALYGGPEGGSIQDLCKRGWQDLPCARRFYETLFFERLGDDWVQGQFKVDMELHRLMRPRGIPN